MLTQDYLTTLDEIIEKCWHHEADELETLGLMKTAAVKENWKASKLHNKRTAFVT